MVHVRIPEIIQGEIQEIAQEEIQGIVQEVTQETIKNLPDYLLISVAKTI